MSELLVLDVHLLCHRAFHTMKNLSWEGKATGVIFGFLKTLNFLRDELQTDQFAFCFEHPHLYRKDIYPAYKQKRAEQRTPEEKRARKELSRQIGLLRERYLPMIGFRNIHYVYGYESDDLMAEIAELHLRGEVILVTSDSDLFQCLKPDVSIYSPSAGRVLTKAWFEKKYGIHPLQWARVKAIAGCATDEVKGIPRIGELTALKFLRGELKESSAAYKAIDSARGQAIAHRNRRLVRLPFEDCPTPIMQRDRLSKKGWEEVCDELGMKSLAGGFRA